MAYDRYDTRDAPRDERSRWSDEDRSSNRDPERGWRGEDRGREGERGFWDRASDEISSWFGDEDAERRRRGDEMRDRRSEERGQRSSSRSSDRSYDRGYGRDYDRDRSAGYGRYGNPNDNRGLFARGGSSERDYNPDWRQEHSGRDFNRERADRQTDRGWSDRYRPMAGDYGRGSNERDRDEERGSQSPWARDEYRSTSRAGSANWSDKSREDFSRSPNEQRSRDDRHDPHYRSWRDRHMSELDRDYDDYRAENQSRFESDFGSWRERRQQKRSLLGRIREHMEVVGSDDKHVGSVDKVAGDRIILTRSDPESGGVHHSLSCSDIDRVEGDRVILDCSADQARDRWRDEHRSRALFERDDQGEMGPRVLDRSFEGTYRR
jgi:hypothetical protein